MVNWTENRLKRVKLLHKEGHSAAVIARKLGAAFSKGIILRKLREFEAQRLRRADMRAARKAAKAPELAQLEATPSQGANAKAIVPARQATTAPAHGSPAYAARDGEASEDGFGDESDVFAPSGHHAVRLARRAMSVAVG